LTGRILTALDKHLHGYDESVSELNEQIKELKIQLRVLKRQRLNMESIIYGIRDAVIVTDQSDKLLIANETAGRLFNFDYRHSQYKNFEQLLDKNKFNLTDLLQKSRKSRTRHTKYELEIGCNGEIKTFDCVVSCIFDESQNVCGVVAILHDITREKEAARMKNDFVSHVSHELKTPLASISAYAEMLVDGEANNEEMRKEFYSVIQSQAQRLNRLIEDILNISRIESGLVKVDKKLVSLAMVIREQMQMIKGYADEKNIRIIVPEPILYDQIYGDKDMISQVVVNLLSNAVKYTPDGGTVTIGIEVDESEKLARVSITDTGVGIPEEEIGSIFKKFYRVKANQNVAKGTGLGLNLVKQIIEKVHNGRIFVRSKVGVGSTFGFELPLAGAKAAEEKIKV
jgi:two-component system phosphate regulon sensor histidine kinase PhoR